MTSRIKQVEIRNFKAFRELSLSLEGRHLLLYGPNGSGKSSLYWALYTFLQSAGKTPNEIRKYFDPVEAKCLLNIHENPGVCPGEIALTLRETSTKTDTTYRISKDNHGIHRNADVQKMNLASDFITYRFFFGFSDFRASEKFNLWPLFEKEILPFCVSTASGNPLQMWQAIKRGKANPLGSRGLGGAQAYRDFRDKVDQFAAVLSEIVDTISNKAQEFYDEHFACDDNAKVDLKIGVITKPSFSGKNQQNGVFTPPIIKFGIRVGTKVISKPQVYLNEAKLTQLALSVRLAASLVNLHDSVLKLLVVDDLLVSLDMSNRMKVVEILLSETFSEYQKIILTHDHGFFQEFRRLIDSDHSNWCFYSLSGNPKDGVECIKCKTAIEQAEDYLNCNDLEAAAFQLRKAAEKTANAYKHFALNQETPPGEFHSLFEVLKAARNKISEELPVRLYEQATMGIPPEHRDKLISLTDEDIEADVSLDPAMKGKIKCQRKRLKSFLMDEVWNKFEAIKTIDAVLRMKDRVLNPAAHWNETPLYDAEVRKAYTLIRRLENVLLNRPEPY